LNAEKHYRAAMKQWESYLTWQTQRKPILIGLHHSYRLAA
jgi:hypothetical protein